MSEFIHNFEGNMAEHDGDVVSPDDLPDLADTSTWHEQQEQQFQHSVQKASEAMIRQAEIAGLEYGTHYDATINLIETGLEKSRKGGYAVVKVTLDGKEVTLAQFLATDLFRMRGRGELTKEGVDSILQKYVDTAKGSKSETSNKNSAQPTERYQSGKRTYRDFQSAAAGDYDQE